MQKCHNEKRLPEYGSLKFIFYIGFNLKKQGRFQVLLCATAILAGSQEFRM